MVDRTGLFVAPLPGTTPQGTSPTDGRLVLGSLFGTNGGRLSGGDFNASSTAMQVFVSASVWRIPDPTTSLGVYLSPADITALNFSAGPASGSRIDVIWVRQNNFEAGDPDSRVAYGVTTGTAAASPAVPAIPTGAMNIGKLTVPTGASNAAACTLVPTYPAVVLPPAIGATTKTLLDTVAGAHVGQLAVVAGITYRWIAGAWRPWDSDWTTWTPTLTNIQLAGTSKWRYRGGEVEVDGGGTVVNAAVNGPFGRLDMSLPVKGAFLTTEDLQGGVWFGKSGESLYDGRLQVKSDTSVYLDASTVVTRNGNQVVNRAAVSSTVPITWGANDRVTYRYTYTPSLTP